MWYANIPFFGSKVSLYTKVHLLFSSVYLALMPSFCFCTVTKEWQKAIYSVGGSEVKKWPLQLRRSVPDGMPANTNGTSLDQQEMSLIQERTLPSSPSPLYSSHTKASFMKGGLGQPIARKQLLSGQTLVDNSWGLLQWVQSISFVSVSVDHSLHLVLQADSPSSGELSFALLVNSLFS